MVYSREEQVDAAETRDAVEREGRRCVLLPGDVTESAFCEKTVERTINEFGQLSVLVNNAAFQQHQSSILDLTDEQFEKTFRTNIFGYFYMAQAMVPRMQTGSAIVNTASIAGERPRNAQGCADAASGGMIIAGKSPPEDFVRSVTS